MPWLWQPNSPVGQPNGLGPPMLNYAAPPSPTSQGAGVAAAGQQAWQWLQDQRAESVRQGLLDPDTGLPTQKGVVEGLRDTAQGVMMGTTAPGDVPPPGIVAYHGSPHSFDQFDTSKIGTGEGAQAYGHGLYFAGNEGVARSYRDQLAGPPAPGEFLHSGNLTTPPGGFKPITDVLERHQGDFDKAIGDPAVPDSVKSTLRDWQKSGIEYVPSQSPGSMYQVNIGADPEHFLDWDKPLSEQHPVVENAIADLVAQHRIQMGNATGARAYHSLAEQLAPPPPPDPGGWTSVPGGPVAHDAQVHDPAAAAKALQQAGIPGIRYLDQGSRGAGQGSHNYVVFDANTIQVLKKYGLAGLMLGAGGVASQQSGNGQ
jgi:hypothetical protein